MNKTLFAKFQRNFVAGLLVILPAALSLWLVAWVLGSLSNVTDTLLIFLPKTWTHKGGPDGPLHWYSSVLAFMTAVALIAGMGMLARIYIGQQLIQFLDSLMLRVPLINKIYSTIKQVNDAFSGSKASFKQVVLIEYPRKGVYSLGFITNDQLDTLGAEAPAKLVSVFVPTTPNPTSGFIVLVPETDLLKLKLPVADGIKFIISLGSLSPEQQQEQLGQLKS